MRKRTSQGFFLLLVCLSHTIFPQLYAEEKAKVVSVSGFILGKKDDFLVAWFELRELPEHSKALAISEEGEPQGLLEISSLARKGFVALRVLEGHVQVGQHIVLLEGKGSSPSLEAFKQAFKEQGIKVYR